MGVLMRSAQWMGWVARLCAGAVGAACGEVEPLPTEFDAVYRDGDSGALPSDASATNSDTASGTASGTATGTWAMATDWSTCVHIGESRFELRSYKLLHVEVQQVGYVWKETRKVCSVVNTALLGQVTVFPPAVIQSLATQQIMSTVTGVGEGQFYSGGLDIQLLGVKLTEPATEAMPSSPGDPRVVDSDGDGKPGATLLVGQLCQIYAANRALSQVHGQWVKPGRIEGGAIHDTTQVALASTSSFCESAFPTLPNHPHHAFVLQRVDGEGLNLDSDGDGAVSCAEIIAQQTQVITWRQADAARCATP